jgi:hypothetical protein
MLSGSLHLYNQIKGASLMSDDFIIYSYTADDAMRDGILHDVTPMAKEVGFRIPVRITIGVKQLLTPDEEVLKFGQSYDGRLWDVLNIAFVAIKSSPDENLASFHVTFRNGPGKENKKKLWAALDMTGGPAIHIFLPEEY